MNGQSTARGEARLRALIDAAAEMFLEHGYEAVSIDILIARAGGSRRNIYSAFGGKEGLFIEVVTRLCDDLLRPLMELEISYEDEHHALTLFGEKILDIVLQPRALALHRLMVAEAARIPKVAQAIYRAGPGNVGEMLARWIGEKQICRRMRRDLDARDMAETFVELIVSGSQAKALVGITSVPLSEAAKRKLSAHAVAIFLYGAASKTK